MRIHTRSFRLGLMLGLTLAAAEAWAQQPGTSSALGAPPAPDAGAWFFKLDGFNGWNGEDWGMPNISSAQDWDHGPPGAHAPSTGKPAA